MFGSDYPSIPYERLFREWNELGYSDDVKDGIFHGNAERILRLSPAASEAAQPASTSGKEHS